VRPLGDPSAIPTLLLRLDETPDMEKTLDSTKDIVMELEGTIK
jgi:hypothetical protein